VLGLLGGLLGRAVEQHLAVHADRCERRAQFVRDRRDEILGALRLLEVALDAAPHQHEPRRERQREHRRDSEEAPRARAEAVLDLGRVDHDAHQAVVFFLGPVGLEVEVRDEFDLGPVLLLSVAARLADAQEVLALAEHHVRAHLIGKRPKEPVGIREALDQRQSLAKRWKHGF
jgi:hypothetical protein